MAEPVPARLERFFKPQVALLFVLVFGAFITWRWSASRVCEATWSTLTADEIERHAIALYLERVHRQSVAPDDARVLALRAAHPDCCPLTVSDPPFLLAPATKSQYVIELKIRNPPPPRGERRGDTMKIVLDACGRRLLALGPES